MSSEYVVIGAGQFGRAVAQSLTALGQSVLVIDVDRERIEEMVGDVDAAVTADATDERALQDLGVAGISTAVVTIGTESVEASILTTALLRQLGVPRIVARAINTLHARVLQSVGAHEVLNPEEEMGRRLAARLAHPTIHEQFELGNAHLAEVELPERFVGKSLKELDMRRHHKVTVMAVRRGEQVLASPDAEMTLASGDVLLLIGAPDAVHAVASLA